jgi:restriction system protein
MENSPQNVLSALEILLEEIEADIEFVNRRGASAFERRDYDMAREALELAARVTAFRDKIAALRDEWQGLTALVESQEDEASRTSRRNLGRLRRGMRTPETAYYKPILQAVAEMGGSGRIGDVLARVLEIMKPVLRDVDFEPLTSDPENPRWRNSAQWARNTLVNKGFLKNNSPRGVWEISDAGQQLLAKS